MVHTPPEQIDTPRLRLRPPRMEDAADIFQRWAQDPDVTRYLVWRPHEHIGETEAHIARCREGWSSGTNFVWLLENRETGRLVGSLSARSRAHGVDLGYLLAKDAWGKGYMVEALGPVVSWFLSQPDVHRVWATCDVDNRASARVLEKADFEFEGILRQWEHHPNLEPGRRDARCYSRTKSDTDSAGRPNEEEASMGRVVIVAYHPRDGKQAELMNAIRDHVPMLQREGFATDREPLVLRSKDGSYLEIFEWKSPEAIAAAHSNPAVQQLWERFGEVCEYRTLASLSEATEMFAEFEPVAL